MPDLVIEDKDVVAINSGIYHEVPWKSTVYLTASGTYHAIAKVGHRQVKTEETRSADSAKQAGLSEVAALLEII